MSQALSVSLAILRYSNKQEMVQDCSDLVDLLFDKYMNSRKASQRERVTAFRELIRLQSKIIKYLSAVHVQNITYLGVKKYMKINIALVDKIFRNYERIADILRHLIRLGKENPNELAEAQPVAAAKPLGPKVNVENIP